MKQKWIPLVLAVLMLCTSCSLIPKEEELPQAPVLADVASIQYETTTVVRGDIFEEKTFSCKYQPAEEEKLSFQEKGQAISTIYVEKGDVVQAGDLIAELDNTQVLKDIENQERSVESLEMQIEQERDYISVQQKRIQVLTEAAKTNPELYEGQLQSVEQAVQSKNEQIDYLKSLLTIEQTRLRELKNSLEQRQLRAGINGTVSYVLQLSDSTLYTSESQIVCVIMDLSSASFVGEFEGDYFAVGDSLNIVYDGAEHEAVVEKVSVEGEEGGAEASEPEESTQEAAETEMGETTEIDATEQEQPEEEKTYIVHFALVTPDASLQAGDSAKFTLITQSREDVLYLPEDAIYHQGDVYYVYYFDENGYKAVKNIEVGLAAEEKVEIISGLTEGEEVII